MSRPRVRSAVQVADDAQVVSVEGGGGYRRRPCSGCPWRVDATGSWPAEAFAVSASTAQEMSTRQFGCHESGAARPVTCAGFLLRGAEHNMAVRLAIMQGRIDPRQVTDGGHELHGDYVEMAVANGLDPDDPALSRCRRGSYADIGDDW